MFCGVTDVPSKYNLPKYAYACVLPASAAILKYFAANSKSNGTPLLPVKYNWAKPS